MQSILNMLVKLIKFLAALVLIFVLSCVAIDQFVALSARPYIDVKILKIQKSSLF